MLYLGIALLSMSIILFILRSVARVRAIQIERCQVLRDEFFASATALVEDARTPDLLVEVTEFLAYRIADKHLTWQTLWRLISGGINRKYDDARRDFKPIEDVAAIPPDLLKIWRHLTKAFVLAITFNNFLIGSAVRRLFLWPATLHDGPCDNGDGNAEMGSGRAEVVVQDLVESRFPTLQHAYAGPG